MRKLIIMLAALAMLAALVPTASARPDNPGQTSAMSATERRAQAKNMSVDLPPQARVVQPPAYGLTGDFRPETHFERVNQPGNRDNLKGLDRAREVASAIAVDNVLAKVNTDPKFGPGFAFGVGEFGQIVAEVTNDYQYEVARSVLGPDVEIDIVPIEQFMPLAGINAPEYDRRFKDDGTYYYGAGHVGVIHDAGSQLQSLASCTSGPNLKITRTGNNVGHYATTAEHCARGWGHRYSTYAGGDPSYGGTVYAYSLEDGTWNLGGYNPVLYSNRFLGQVRHHDYSTTWGAHSYKWVDTVVLANPNRKAAGYIWHSDPECWATPSPTCGQSPSTLAKPETSKVRKVIGGFDTYDPAPGTHMGVSTRQIRGTIEGIHLADNLSWGQLECDGPSNWSSTTKRNPWTGEVLPENCSFGSYWDGAWGGTGPGGSVEYNGDPEDTVGYMIYIPVSRTTTCECAGFVGGASGSPVYEPVGLDSARIAGILVSSTDGKNRAVFVSLRTIRNNMLNDPRITDVRVTKWWESGYGPNF